MLCGGSELRVVEDRIRDFEYGAPGTYQWQRCEDCGLIRLHPQPTDAVLALAYPAGYHAYVQPRSALTKWLIRTTRARAAREFATKLPPGGTVLDIGCSTGDLLLEISRHGAFRLLGSEYTAWAAEEARRKGIEVWQGDFEQADVTPASVDLALMQHVLEHVNNPVATLLRVNRLLRRGGRVVGELPNYRSWDCWLFRRYWGGGHAPRHLFHFTPDTLRHAFTRCGFGNVRISPSLHTGHWALSVQNVLRRNRTDLVGLSSGRTWYYPVLMLATIPVNLLQMPLLRTGIIRFEATKP